MKLNLVNILSGYNLSQINANFQAIATELQNKVLYRNNPVSEPNALETDIDANSKNIYNVHNLSIQGELTVNGLDLAGVAESAQEAIDAAAAALTSEQNALIYSNDAAASYALTDSIADAFAGGSIGFQGVAYDWGSVADATTYFNRDFGLIV